VSLSLATEWAAVPAYARSIEALEGSVTLPDLLEQVAANERHMTSLARIAFAAWLEHVVGQP
jgi:hypothetical protein